MGSIKSQKFLSAWGKKHDFFAKLQNTARNLRSTSHEDILISDLSAKQDDLGYKGYLTSYDESFFLEELDLATKISSVSPSVDTNIKAEAKTKVRIFGDVPQNPWGAEWNTAEPYHKYYIGMMHTIVNTLKGTSFVLAVRDKFGSIGFYPRTSQPCYGEMRKYQNKNSNHKQAVAHGDLAKSGKQKPTDLYCPFPSGEPEMIGFYVRAWNVVTEADQKYLPIINFLFSDQSPWIKGFGSSKAVELVWKDKKLNGFVVKTSDIDPSVLVQMLWTFRHSSIQNFQNFLDAGASMKEACLLILPQGGGYGPKKCDLKRFFQADPRELSGGTLREGGDYARSWSSQPFGAEACWHSDDAEEFNKKVPVTVPTGETYESYGNTYPKMKTLTLPERIEKLREYIRELNLEEDAK